MALGFCNTPSNFQYEMNTVFFDILDDTIIIYLDDIVIYSKDIKSHCTALHAVF